MPRFLPLRCDQSWLNKAVDSRLDEARLTDRETQPEQVISTLAKEYGFANWNSLVDHVDSIRKPMYPMIKSLESLPMSDEKVEADDENLAELLEAIRGQDFQQAIKLASTRPALARAYGMEGKTPLHVAVERNEAQVSLFLVALGADPFATIRNSHHDALSWAVTCRAIEAACGLIRIGACPDFYVRAGMGLLEQVKACFDSDGRLRRRSCQKGSSRYDSHGKPLPTPPENTEDRIADAIAIAARNGFPHVVKYLLTKEPNLDFRSFAGATPLHWAYFGGCEASIRCLLESGANPETLDTTFGCNASNFSEKARVSWGLDSARQGESIRLEDRVSLPRFDTFEE